MDNVIKALMLCRATNGWRSELANPHYYKMPNGQMVAYATDSHILLLCKDTTGWFDKYDFEPTQTPNIASVIPTDICTGELDRQRLANVFAQIPVLNYKLVTCKECNGNGTVTWEYTDKHGEYYCHDFDCPVCDGDGGIKTNGTSLPNDYSITIGATAYHPKQIERLLQVMELLDIDTIAMAEQADRLMKLENDKYLILQMGGNPGNDHILTY